MTGRRARLRRDRPDRSPDRAALATAAPAEADEAERRVCALLAEMVLIDPLLDDAIRDCAGPPPHGAKLARRVSRYARKVCRTRGELAELPVPADLRAAIDDQLSYRQQMLEQALLLVFRPRAEATERVRRGLAGGFGPRAGALAGLVASARSLLPRSASKPMS